MKSIKYSKIACVGILATGLLLAPACGSKEEGSGGASTDTTAPATEGETVSLEGPIADEMRSAPTDAAAIAKGKELYAQCIGCHGPTGEGMTALGPRLNSKTFLAAASDDMLIRNISKGRLGTPMIAWSSVMKPEEISKVVSYMRSWSEIEEAALNHDPLAGEPVAGKRVYMDICSGCHGVTGAGIQETGNGTGIGRKSFTDEVSNGFLRYVIKNGKSQTKMKPFAEDSHIAVANLTDKQIDDVIAHLRTSAW
ncbi:MAG: c-type cytochrome [Myxococcales bacterium]|nr:c-type cytochrome [Myxococcales bacterium]